MARVQQAQALLGLLQGDAEVEGLAALLEADAENSLAALVVLDADGEEAGGVEDGLHDGDGGVGGGGEELAVGGVFEDDVDLDVVLLGGDAGGGARGDGDDGAARGADGDGLGGGGGLPGGLENAQAGGEDLAFGPAGSRVALIGGQGRDVVDVGAGGEEEDALDRVGGEGRAGCGIGGLHCLLSSGLFGE